MLSLYNAAAVTDADGMRAAGSLILWLGACAHCAIVGKNIADLVVQGQRRHTVAVNIA